MTELAASTACPICRRDTPHAHLPSDIKTWVNARIASWGFVADIQPLGERSSRDERLKHDAWSEGYSAAWSDFNTGKIHPASNGTNNPYRRYVPATSVPEAPEPANPGSWHQPGHILPAKPEPAKADLDYMVETLLPWAQSANEEDLTPREIADRCRYFLGSFDSAKPEPAKASGWVPEPGERVAYGPNIKEHGKVVRVLTIAYVDWDEGHRGSHEVCVLRPLPAPPDSEVSK